MRSLAKVSLLLVLCSAALADVAPGPGYIYVPVDLILVTEEDISAFRFFLISPGDLQEVRVPQGSRLVVSGANRGGVSLFAQLFAVPVSEIGSSFPESHDLAEFKSRFGSAQQVLSHTFKTSVSIVEEPIWSPPVVQLSIKNGVVVATQVPQGFERSRLVTTGSLVAVGVLIAIGIAIIGLWLFRRSRKKV